MAARDDEGGKWERRSFFFFAFFSEKSGVGVGLYMVDSGKRQAAHIRKALGERQAYEETAHEARPLRDSYCIDIAERDPGPYGGLVHYRHYRFAVARGCPPLIIIPASSSSLSPASPGFFPSLLNKTRAARLDAASGPIMLMPFIEAKPSRTASTRPSSFSRIFSD